MPRRSIEVVLFDLDDTLHDDTSAYRSAARQVAEDVARERGISSDALEAAYVAEADAFWHRLSATDLTVRLKNVRAKLWRRALARIGINDEALGVRCANAYHEYRRGNFALFPGALDLLQSLRSRGKRIGLVTNGFAETHHEKITLLKLRDVLDAIFIADEVGMLKPDPQIFAHACRTLGVAPEAAAMVGDRYERDIRGAIEAGLYTIWVNVRGEPLPPGAVPPDATCGSILEVGAILDAASVSADAGL
jgi:putative hydrolase of the HAD superfamily